MNHESTIESTFGQKSVLIVVLKKVTGFLHQTLALFQSGFAENCSILTCTAPLSSFTRVLLLERLFGTFFFSVLSMLSVSSRDWHAHYLEIIMD